MGDRHNNAKNNGTKPKQVPAQETTDQSSQRYLEYLKTEYDLLKHLMTLSVATLAAMGALVGGFFPDPGEWYPGTFAFLGSSAMFLSFAAYTAGEQAWTAKDKILSGQEPKSAEEVSQFLEKKRRPGWLPLRVLAIGIFLFGAFVAINLSY